MTKNKKVYPKGKSQEQDKKKPNPRLPQLGDCLDKIIIAEETVRQKIYPHRDIYNLVNLAIRDYKINEAKEKGSGNDNDLKRSLYLGTRLSIESLLHHLGGGEDQYQQEVYKFRKTTNIRLAYVDPLIQAAAVSTYELKGVGFKHSDLIDWKEAKKCIENATHYNEGNKDSFVKNINKAYKILEKLKQKASDAYEGKIPR